jgi:hypothetical protein
VVTSSTSPAVVAQAPSRQSAASPAIDAAMTERLVDDVIRRIERRLRIERERRGM